MTEPTLESLSQRMDALERLVKDSLSSEKKDWRAVVGMFAGNEYQKAIDEAGFAIREQDRAEAEREADLEDEQRKSGEANT